MLYVYSVNLKADSAEKFQSWAHEAERRFAAAAPKGWSFRGLYLSAFGLGPAQAEVHWEVDNYSAFDAAVDAQRSGGDYADVVGEFFSFADPRTQSARVLRAVSDRNLTLVKGSRAALAF